MPTKQCSFSMNVCTCSSKILFIFVFNCKEFKCLSDILLEEMLRFWTFLMNLVLHGYRQSLISPTVVKFSVIRTRVLRDTCILRSNLSLCLYVLNPGIGRLRFKLRHAILRNIYLTVGLLLFLCRNCILGSARFKRWQIRNCFVLKSCFSG